MSYSNIIRIPVARRVLMAGELPVGIRKEPADEIAHTSRNNTAIVSPEMSVLGPDVLAVQIETGGIRRDVRTHGLRGTAEHVPVVFAETQVSVAVAARHFDGNGGGDAGGDAMNGAEHDL